ncbi:MAG: hypothetical protein IH597_14650 [Bacteroidales bacterium]|nr:hypothetical protein [Bacteroidales bacterium]
MKSIFQFLFYSILLGSCLSDEDKHRYEPQSEAIKAQNEASDLAYAGISELRKGDIIVKPNLNILPGTSFVEGGWGYGHAAIVTVGAKNMSADSLLASCMIFESHARPVHRIHQLREVPGFIISDDPAIHNNTFAPRFAGNRYRLRLNITESQVDSIIAFVRSQKGSYSSWNAMKRFPETPEVELLVNEGKRASWADNTHWYCSQLIWQSVYYVTGIDLDPNGGYFVYPSDLISSPWFDNTRDFEGRARF